MNRKSSTGSTNGDYFVGRAQEIELLLHQVQQAMDGHPRLAVIEGRPGIGKTALVRHVASLLSGWTVLGASADAHEAHLPGAVLGQLTARAGKELLEDLPILSSDNFNSTTPFAAGAKLLHLLGELQENQPVALILDDLQWVDDFSLRALMFTLRRLGADQVLTILTARSGDSTKLLEFLSFLEDSSCGAHLTLRGLTRNELAELAAAVLGTELNDSGISRLEAQTHGHALYVRTLLTELSGDALQSGDRFKVPPSLRLAIYKVLAPLSSDCRVLLESLAVLDSRVSLATAAQLGGLSDSRCVAIALSELTQAGLVEWWPHEPTTPVAICHTLQREAIYDLMTPERRHELHLAAANLVDKSNSWGHRVAATAGTDPLLAAELDSAANVELREGRHAQAGTLLIWASELSAHTADREHRLLKAALTLLSANQLPMVVARKNQIEACAPGPVRDLVLITTHLTSGKYAEAGRLATEVLRAVHNAPDSMELAQQTGYLLPWGLLVAGHVREAIEVARWALSTGKLDPHILAGAVTILSGAVSILSGPAAALNEVAQWCQKAVQVSASQAELVGTRGVWKVIEGSLHDGISDLSLAMQLVRDGAALTACRRLWGYAAWAQYVLGDWDEATLSAETAVDEALSGGYLFDGPFEYLVGLWVPAARGDSDRVQCILRKLEETSRPLGDVGRLLSGTGHAIAARAQGNHVAMHEALKDWHEAAVCHVDIAMTERWWRPLLAEAQAATGRYTDARKTLTRLGSIDHITYLHSQVQRIRGSILEYEGKTREALDAYELAALRQHDESPFDTALARLASGALLLRNGQRRLAATHLDESREILMKLQAAPFHERCLYLLTQCGITKGGSRSGGTVLTEREREIARHIGEGLTNREIADLLYLSPKTVEYHLGHVYMKLRIGGRKELRQYIKAGHLRL
ncbi:helix-turn-helix transcriptional regulator [Streptomyces chartreusis]|uniref:helix-turn-helix transcriptional regulator n=1 Tax=Streptomyces chartreusis TaxID=1969 RepID=UPI00369ECC83